MRRRYKKEKIELTKKQRLIRFLVIAGIVFVVVAMIGLAGSAKK